MGGPGVRGPPARFAGKVAFITGGAVGFGRAFARAFTSEGAAVVVADIDAEAGSDTDADIGSDTPVNAVAGGNSTNLSGDIRQGNTYY